MTIESDAQLNKEALVAMGELATLGMLDTTDDGWQLNDKGRARARKLMAERFPEMKDEILVILLAWESESA